MPALDVLKTEKLFLFQSLCFSELLWSHYIMFNPILSKTMKSKQCWFNSTMPRLGCILESSAELSEQSGVQLLLRPAPVMSAQGTCLRTVSKRLQRTAVCAQWPRDKLASCALRVQKGSRSIPLPRYNTGTGERTSVTPSVKGWEGWFTCHGKHC